MGASKRQHQQSSQDMGESKRQHQQSSQDMGESKRQRYSKNSAEGREIFISNIPYDVSQIGLEGALKRMFGKYDSFVGIRKLIMNRGFAFVEFKDAEGALKAVNENQDKKMGRRTLRIQLSQPSGSSAGPGSRSQQPVNDSPTHPNPDCWFCLANPNFEKHLIFGVDSSATVYVSLAKGQIRSGHCLVCPVTHFGCYVQADETARSACEEMVSRLRDMYASRGEDVIVYERWIPLNSAAANHMQIHVVPVPKDLSIDWKAILKRKGKDVGIEFVDAREHADVIDRMAGILHRVSYLYMSFPGGQTMVGLGKMPFTFPREVVCEGLGSLDRVDWKSCQASVEEETATAIELKESLQLINDQSSE
jgi:RNA recognition motif-containing protein